MHIVLIVVGLVVGFVGYLGGLTMNPASAPQQTVQYLSFIQGALGLVLVGLGGVAAAVKANGKASRKVEE